jgi:GT2 family glycosyltransferase
MASPADPFKSPHSRTAAAALEAFLSSGARLRGTRSSSPQASVLLVLHNRAELTLRCLISLQYAAVPHELVIVDNASTDETRSLLHRIDVATVVRNEANVGFVEAANQAAALARGEFLLFLNNDCELLPGSFESAVARLREDDGVGSVVGRLIALDGSLQEAGGIVWADGTCSGYGRGGNPQAPEFLFERDVDFGSGALLLTRRSAFVELDGFDPVFRPAYYEDADYCLRLWERGRRVVYDPRAAALHFEFASAPSPTEAVAQQIRNRPGFARKHAAALRNRPDPGSVAPLFVRSRSEGLRVLIVDDRVPHAGLGQGYPRALALLGSLRRQGHFVTLYPLLFPGEPWDTVYASVPRDVEVMLGRGTAHFEDFWNERTGYYDLAIVSRPSTVEALRRCVGEGPLLGATPWLYDAEALASVREIGRRRLAGEAVNATEAKRLVSAETRLAEGAKAVISVSEREAEPFRASGRGFVVTLGHVVAPRPSPVPFEDREGLLFVGAVTDDASPNADALVFLVTEVLPRLAALRGRPMPLSIAGWNASARVAGLVGPHVSHVGPVESLAPLYDRARIFVAPARFAAGLPLKVYDAAAHGLPIVASGLIAEQIGWADRVELLVARDADALARACAELDSDAALWRSLGERALSRVAADCSAEAFDAVLRDVLQAVVPSRGRPRPAAGPPARGFPSRSEAGAALAPACLPDDRIDRAAHLEGALFSARHDLRALRASASWRWTAPLRRLHAWWTGRSQDQG